MHLRANYRGGAFVGEHGSWDRPRFNGYKVVFVPFSGGRPSGKAEDSLRDLRPGCKNRCAEGLDRGLGSNFTDLFTSSDSTSGRRKVYSSCVYCD
jgi:hypothetical protein